MQVVGLDAHDQIQCSALQISLEMGSYVWARAVQG